MSLEGKEALLSSNTDEWETPLDFYERLNDQFDFTLDPCCTSKNQKCALGYGLDKGKIIKSGEMVHASFNGLDADWTGERVYVNPPYSNCGAWVSKCYYESKRGVTSVMLLPATKTDQAWWHDVVIPRASEVRFIRGRLKFGGRVKVRGQPKGLPKEQYKYEYGWESAPFASVVVIFRPNDNDWSVRTMKNR